MSSLHELCRRSDHGIFAVPYRDGRPQKPSRLPDGAIVESPLPHQRREVPARVAGCFEVAHGDVPATIHHANLGLVIAHLPLSGVFLLPDGEVAAIYGADASTIDAEPVAVT